MSLQWVEIPNTLGTAVLHTVAVDIKRLAYLICYFLQCKAVCIVYKLYLPPNHILWLKYPVSLPRALVFKTN